MTLRHHAVVRFLEEVLSRRGLIAKAEMSLTGPGGTVRPELVEVLDVTIVSGQVDMVMHSRAKLQKFGRP